MPYASGNAFMTLGQGIRDIGRGVADRRRQAEEEARLAKQRADQEAWQRIQRGMTLAEHGGGFGEAPREAAPVELPTFHAPEWNPDRGGIGMRPDQTGSIGLHMKGDVPSVVPKGFGATLAGLNKTDQPDSQYMQFDTPKGSAYIMRPGPRAAQAEDAAWAAKARQATTLGQRLAGVGGMDPETASRVATSAAYGVDIPDPNAETIYNTSRGLFRQRGRGEPTLVPGSEPLPPRSVNWQRFVDRDGRIMAFNPQNPTETVWTGEYAQPRGGSGGFDQTVEDLLSGSGASSALAGDNKPSLWKRAWNAVWDGNDQENDADRDDMASPDTIVQNAFGEPGGGVHLGGGNASAQQTQQMDYEAKLREYGDAYRNGQLTQEQYADLVRRLREKFGVTER